MAGGNFHGLVGTRSSHGRVCAAFYQKKLFGRGVRGFVLGALSESCKGRLKILNFKCNFLEEFFRMKLAAEAVRFFQAASAEGWRGHAAASFFYGILKLIKPRDKRIDSNLDLIYPEYKDNKLWHRDFKNKVYKNLAWTISEILAVQKDISKALDWITEVEGFEYLDEFIDNRKHGLLFLTGHFGNWELLGYWYAQIIKKHGGKLYVVAQEMHDKDITRIIDEYRVKSGAEVILKDTSTLELVKMLKDGAHIAILNDVAWSGGEILPFMGQPCTNTIGPATLAMLSGVPMMSVAIYRTAPFRHKVKFLKPFHVPDNINNNHDKLERIKSATMQINKNLEMLISQCPELWFWLHDRWKMNKLERHRH